MIFQNTSWVRDAQTSRARMGEKKAATKGISMTEAASFPIIKPVKGFRYAERVMVVEPAEEARLLGHCGIDIALFGGNVDPAAFISLAIQEGVRNGISANGGVNMVQGLVQHRPLKLGEDIIVTGEILEVEQTPRGTVTTSETWFANARGERAITAFRRSLKTDPTKEADPNLRGAGTRPDAVVTDVAALKELGTYSLTPEHVRGYGLRTTNYLHTEPEAAKRAGYRAPIIGGGHGVRYMTAAIWQKFNPTTIDMSIYFRRPLFWDDSFTVRVDDQGGQWQSICLAKGDKIATEARIKGIG
jgi:acyl dehydratase